jgi:hypothetical protein
MKTAQVFRLEAVTSLVRHREELTDEQLLDLLRSVLGCGRSSSARRSKRYRDGKRSSDTPSSVTASVEPTRQSVTNVTPERDDRHASVTPITPVPSVPPGPPSGSLSPSLPKEIAVGSEEPVRVSARAERRNGAAKSVVHLLVGGSGTACGAPFSTGVGSGGNDSREHVTCPACLATAEPGKVFRDWKKRPPTSLDDALEMPLEERCQLVLARPDVAQWIQPDKWPEVRLAVVSFRAAVGKPRLPVGSFGTDAGVKRLVELYAAGLSADDVCSAIPRVVASAWWRSGDAPRDLGSMTLTVVRRSLAEQPKAVEPEGLPRPMFGGQS